MDCPSVSCTKPMIEAELGRYTCSRCHRTVTEALIEVQVWRETQPDFGFACEESELESRLDEARKQGDIERIVIEFPDGEQEER